ncbi:MAG: AbrB/MazE/SpoVT family DNA-binding domain-containing protein [bacterium]
MALVKVREKYQITIPQEVRMEVPIDKGEYVNVYVENNHIAIKPVVIEDRFSEEEISLLEKAFQRPENKGKIMDSSSFKEHLRRL